MEAIITLKINDKELGIIIDSLRGHSSLSVADKEVMRLLKDMKSIKYKLEKKLKEKNKGEK